eukprot:1631276-Rhodomonas_salina.1
MGRNQKQRAKSEAKGEIKSKGRNQRAKSEEKGETKGRNQTQRAKAEAQTSMSGSNSTCFKLLLTLRVCWYQAFTAVYDATPLFPRDSKFADE